MNTQTKTLFSALALLLATGAWGAQQQSVTPGSQGQPSASTSQAPGTAQSSTAPGANATGTNTVTQAANPILNMKAGEIAGREIYNTEGKELGKVDMIGRDRTTGELSAIVSVGGFLGFGGTKVAIPLNQLALQNDKLIVSTAMTKKELRRQASGYQSKRYEAVAEDTTLSQVAPAAGTTTGAAPQAQTRTPAAGGNVSFEQLDTNHDGYIERNEAMADPSLLNSWRQADRNHDGRIDQSEFSAFEQAQSEPRPSGDNMREREGARPTTPSGR